MKNPSNARALYISRNAKQFNNWNGNDYLERNKFFQGKVVPLKGGNGMSNAVGDPNGAAMQAGVNVSQGDMEIQVTIQNTYSSILYYPLFNAAGTYTIPFNSVPDPISGNTPSTGLGLVATFDGITAGFLNANITGKQFLLKSTIFDTGTVTGQLAKNWQIYQLELNGMLTTAPYRPKPQQLLSDFVQGTVQLDNLIKAVDVGTTFFVPVLPSNTIVLDLYLGAQFDPKLLLQGGYPVNTYQVPSIR